MVWTLSIRSAVGLYLSAFVLTVASESVAGCWAGDNRSDECMGASGAVPSSAMLQTRARSLKTARLLLDAKDQLDVGVGETVDVHCAPSCHGADEFSLTINSPQWGEATYKLRRDTHSVAKNFHIVIEEHNKTLRKKLPQHLRLCNYQASGMAVSTCSGLFGILTVNGSETLLQQRNDGSFVLGGPQLPDSLDGVSMFEYEDFDDESQQAVCGDGEVDEGEECDGSSCCTSKCTFATKGTTCGSDAEFCHAGHGTCTGDSGACEVSALPDGHPCPDEGMCYQGTCYSRARQCEDQGFHFGACNLASCDRSHCLAANGTCVIALSDVGLLPGSPCGDSKQCVDGQCVRIDVDNQAAKTTVQRLTTRYQAEAAMLTQWRTAETGMVVSPGARSVFSGQMVTMLYSWMNVAFRGAQLYLKQAYLEYPSDSSLDTDPHKGGLDVMYKWLANKRRRRQIPGHVKPVMLINAPREGCTGGLANLPTACSDGGAGVATVVAHGKVCTISAFRTVAHEFGHNFGMLHLEPNVQGKENYIMGGGGQQFHPISIAAYKSYVRKGDFSCLRPGGENNGAGGPMPCLDEDTNCNHYMRQGFCANNPNVKRLCKDTCNLCPSGRVGGDGSCRDEDGHCQLYMQQGHCSWNPNVQRVCKKTCNQCGGGRGGGSCQDADGHCQLYRQQGHCSWNPNVQKLCKKACNLCVGALKMNSSSSR